MKVVKLNRRWKQFKEHRHVAALRFNKWGDDVRAYEQAFKEITRTSGWDKGGEWHGYFGKASGRSGSRPFFITVRDESLITLVLLKVGKNA